MTSFEDAHFEVLEYLQLAFCKMEEIDEQDWSDHMDTLHRRLKQLLGEWEFVELKEGGD